MSTYRVCPGCGFDTCICPDPPATTPALAPGSVLASQTQQQKLKIKLNLAPNPNTTPAARAFASTSHAGSASSSRVKLTSKQVRPPKPGRFSLAHAHSHAAYNPRSGAPKSRKKSGTTAAAVAKSNRRNFSGTKKGGRRGYRPTDDDLYGDESDEFPTFVSAVSSSSEDEDDRPRGAANHLYHRSAPTASTTKGKELHVGDDTDDSDDSDASSDLTDIDDLSMQDEEERFIVAEERARVKRELMRDDDANSKKRFDWQATPSRRSSTDSSDSSDSGNATESESGNGVAQAEEDEDNPEEAVEPDVTPMRVASPVAARCDSSSEDDDDDGFDAAVFFASLDSDREQGRKFVDADDDDDDDDDSISIASAPEPAFQEQDPSFQMPISQDMHGLLVFGDPLTMLADYDIPTVPTTAMADDGGNTTESDDDDDGMDIDTDDGATEDEDNETTLGMESDDDGETTDDMREDEIAEILAPRFATPPPTSVDPLALHLTSAPAPVAAVPPVAEFRTPLPPVKSYTRQRSVSLSALSISSTGSMLPPPPPRRAPKLPMMGHFQNPDVVSPTTSTSAASNGGVVVIDGSTKNIPSPFVRKMRRDLLRMRPKRYSKTRRHVTGSPLSAAGEFSDNSSLYSFSSFGAGPSTSTTTFMDLHDVLDAAILEASEDEIPESLTQSLELPAQSASESETQVHEHSLERWDRIPMNTFRRTRSDATMDLDAALDMTLSFPVGLPASVFQNQSFGLDSALKSPGARETAWWEPNRR
ncbi:hypothetical protein BKA62DRAFT_668631 [Auriculariales sp. MPI-PUGE-AT-0066]|nr:hypothetical protein BKA62DRAFT_668631 [Auriculariales sp. MPI-PUGE-AT-0066]